MKNFLIKPLVLLLLITVFTPSCKKYDEGPRLSFRTKKNRVVGKWKLDQAKVNNVDVTGTDLDDLKSDIGVIEFTKDHDVFYNGDVSQRGRWEFTDNKEDLKITDPDGETSTAEILKLKNDELWLEFVQDDGTKLEMHFIPA